MKKKLSFKTVLALMMAAIMFCLPVGGLFVGTGSVLTVFASDGDVEEETEPVDTETKDVETTVSDNDVEEPESIVEVLMQHGYPISEIHKNKIGLEEYYIELMSAKEAE